MSLKFKTLLILFISIIAFTSATWYLTRHFLLKEINYIEDVTDQNFLERFDALIQSELENLDIKLSDWAAWDDSYQFMVDRNAGYIQSNWIPESLGSLRINFGMIIDSNKNIILKRAYDLESHQSVKLSPETLKFFTTESPLLRPQVEGEIRRGLLSLSDGIYMIAIRPIIPSTGGKAPRGWMLFARKIDKEITTRLERIARLPLKIYSRHKSKFDPQSSLLLNDHLRNSGFRVDRSQPEEVKLNIQYPDFFGAQSIEVSSQRVAIFYLQGKESLLFNLFSLISAGAAVILVTLFLLDYFVLKRIRKIQEAMTEISLTSDYSRRIKPEGSDEIDELGKDFDQLVDLIEDAQAELKATGIRLQMALDASQGGVWDWDLKTNKVNFDRRYNEMLGYSEGALKNDFSTFQKLCHPEDLPKTLQAVQDYVDGKNSGFSVEFRMLTKEGDYKWVRSEACLLRGPDGTPLRLTGWHRDIHQFRLNAKLLEDQRFQLLQASKMSALGEMSGGIAHEINNPLAIIQGSAEALQFEIDNGSPDHSKITKGLDTIIATCGRIANIIKSLRTIARDSTFDSSEPVCLNDIIEECLVLSRQKFKNQEIEMRIEVPDQQVQISARPSEISQILLNLMINARDAIESLPEKWIGISLQVHEGQVFLAVSNAGKPIAPEIQIKMFEPFFTTKEVGRGTGLGLSISERLAKSNGGRLQYDAASENPRFILEFPELNPLAPMKSPIATTQQKAG